MTRLVLCIFFILILLCVISTYHENFSQDFTTDDPQLLLKINIPILGDSLFDNTILYGNDDLWKNPLGKTGFQKCIKECENKKIGKCVAYGFTGNAMCFTPEI